MRAPTQVAAGAGGRSPGKSATGEPAVSVIIPAFRAARHIAAAISSVFAQTFSSYEIIVVNDGSPDREALLEALRPAGGRILYLEQENRGPAAARNAAIRVARGRFLGFLDADDMWEPDFLSEQIAFLEAHPATDLVYADALLVGGGRASTFMERFPSRGEVTLESVLNKACHVITSGVVVRAERVREAGLFDDSRELASAEDLDLWVRLLRRGARFAYQPKVLVRRREHASSLTADSLRMTGAARKVLEKLARDDGLSPRERDVLQAAAARVDAELHFVRGKDFFARGEFAAAREELETANRYFRSPRLRLVLLGLRWIPNVMRGADRVRCRLAGAIGVRRLPFRP